MAAFARLDGLRVLDIRQKATSDTAPTPADPEIWRAFIRILPRLESLCLPAELVVRPIAKSICLLSTSWPQVWHLRLNVSVPMGELCSRRCSDGGCGPPFSNLQHSVWGWGCVGR
jgi:hypothetical protein